jgi:hypothetical protein
MIQMNTLRFVLLCYGRSLVDFTKNVFISGEDERISGSIFTPTQQHILYVNRLMMNETMETILVQCD